MTPAATPIELALPSRHLTLRGLAFGPEDGTPVIALHGWLDNASTHSRLAAHLQGLRIYALDFAGHGLSDHRPPGSFYHYVENLADITGAADALGLERFSLLGHSMGAGVSSLLAGAIPERIERLVLVEGIGPHTTEPRHLPSLFTRSYESLLSLSERTPRVYASIEAARDKLAQANPTLTSEAVAALIDRGTTPKDDGVVFRHDTRLRGTSMFRFSETQVLAYLSQIQAPTLLVLAQDGWPRDEDLLNARIEAVPNITVVTVPGHHHVHLDHPERVAEAIQAHLQL